jgi:excisionase family DNA binding protein
VQDAVRDAGKDERLTVAEAAERLGITKEAVRKRIHRGTIRSDKDQDGTVRVYISPSDTASATTSSYHLELYISAPRQNQKYTSETNLS